MIEWGSLKQNETRFNGPPFCGVLDHVLLAGSGGMGGVAPVGDANGLAASCSRSSDAFCVDACPLKPPAAEAPADVAPPSNSSPNRSRIGCCCCCCCAVAGAAEKFPFSIFKNTSKWSVAYSLVSNFLQILRKRKLHSTSLNTWTETFKVHSKRNSRKNPGRLKHSMKSQWSRAKFVFIGRSPMNRSPLHQMSETKRTCTGDGCGGGRCRWTEEGIGALLVLIHSGFLLGQSLPLQRLINLFRVGRHGPVVLR